MTNVRIFAGESTHTTTTNVQNGLLALGHVVKGISTTISIQTVPVDYDLAVLVRPLIADAAATGAGIKWLLETGHPAALGMIPNASGDLATHHLKSAGLTTGGLTIVNTGNSKQVIGDNGHPITSGYTVGQVVDPYTAQTFAGGYSTGTLFSGSALATSQASALPDLVAIEQGQVSADSSYALNSRCVVWDGIYASSPYSIAGGSLLQLVIDWLVGPPPIALAGQIWPPKNRLLPTWVP